MPGFKHDPLADVEAIRQLLSGYESGFPFLKEMVQNAQDANATEVYIKWHEGLNKQAVHPLLHGPGLLIVNDGPFNEVSRKGIEMIGLSNRAADTERIGRFGLGIKSLFHVCEAFFFLESEGEENLRGLLTPWHDDTKQATKYHADWWDIEEADWLALATSIKGVLPRCFHQWFAIWVPLRSEKHLSGVKPLRHDLPGNESHCPESLSKAFLHEAPSLAESMIFLGDVNKLVFHDGLHLHEISHRRPKTNQEEGTLGDCRYYASCFCCADSPRVAAFRAKSNWPTVTDRRTTDQVPDKASWEGGCAVSLTPARSGGVGRLRLFWSVFLPVGNQPVLDIELTGCTENVHIFIHGYFFPNRDRTEVIGASDGFSGAGDSQEDALKIAWNKELANSPEGVLRLLVDVLVRCFAAERFGGATIAEVTGKLQRSNWFGLYQKPICQQQSFGRIYGPNGWSWQKFDVGLIPLVFPLLEYRDNEVEGHVATLLGAANLTRDVLVQKSPMLTPHALNTTWNADDLGWFCGAIQRNALASHSGARSYLTRLLSQFSQLAVNNPTFWNDLPIYEVTPICAMLTVVSASDLRGYAEREHLFTGGDANLRKCLKEACPKAHAWFMSGALPPGISARHFDTKAVAKLVLEQNELGGTQKRTALIAKLLADAGDESVKLAIRFLIHGSTKNRDTDGNLFMRLSDNDASSIWNEVVKTVLEHKSESWRLVDATFAIWINDQQKISLNLKMCGADSFRTLCNGTDSEVAELPLTPFHDFLVTHLNEGTHYDADADNKLLRRLKIHRYGEDAFTTIEESVWLAPEVGKEPPKELRQDWSRLCQNAKIVSRIQDDTVGLRQRQLFKDRILDSNGIIRLACQQAEPHHFASLILHYLNAGTPTAETSETLKKASWLPLADDKATTLENLLWLEGADDSLANLVCNRGHDSAMVTRAEIKIRLAEKENTGGWNTMRAHLIPKGDDALELLRTAFGNNPKLHFGLSNLAGSDALGKWLAAVEGCEADISPAVALIRALWPTDQGTDATGKQTWAVKVAAVFAQEWSGAVATRYDTVLEALRDRHRTSESEKREVIISVFHSYLAAAVQGGRWDGEYHSDADFTLLNQLGVWTPVSQLVIPIAGIARRALADERAIRALGFASKAEADDPLPGAIIGQAMDDGALAALLRDYGATISEQLSVKLWGIFVALLGETPTLRALADELTGGRTETVRDELCGPICPGINPRQRVIDCRFSCQITDGDTAEVVALTGDYFDAPLDMDQAAFLVAQSDAGQGQWWINRFFVNQQRDGVHFAFRLCDPQTFAAGNSPQMFERLERTVIQLLQEVLHVSNDRLGKVRPLMEKLMGLGQLSLGRAQQEIIATAQIHLSQLGIRAQQGTPLALAIKRLDEATSLESQAREEHEQEIGDPDRNEKEAKKARDEGLRQLRETLQTDGDVHRLLSSAMKTRIGREQYVPESIPFELFQNADDALAQLAGNEEAPRIFVMEIQNAALRFAHWGRPINHPDEAKGELKRSYERDLVKMLILHGSDKQVGDDDAAVTGKFGLGFKSVYLITDNPQVVSGDLSFDVAGAIYPRRLDKHQIGRLRDHLHGLMPNQQGGTLIELSTAVETGSLAQKFAALAPYLVIFAREIREIRLRGGIDFSHHWQPEKVQDGEGWELWLGDAGTVGKLMQLKCGNVSWLFGLDQHGVRKLPEIPCIWATAPLHSTGEVGFAINGPFDPDPGRTELGKGEAAEKRNAELFLEASKGLYVFLKWCVECDDLCRKLGINHDTPDSFWTSLWTLFSSLPSSAKDMSARLRVATNVWPKESDSGYAGAARTSPIIPNGLPMGFEALTSIDQVCFETSGYLASPVGQDLLSAVGGWQEWTEMEPELRMTADNVISAKVAEVLKRQVADFKTESFSLSFLIRRLAGKDGRVTAALSTRLSQFLKLTVWTDGYNWPREEKLAMEEFLAGLQFQNESGVWVTTMGLLIVDGTGLEAGRAALASSDRRLSQQYSANNALEFFRLCRVEMRVTAEDLADWIRQSLANQDDERVAASLSFLASTTDSYSIESAGFLNGDHRKCLLEHSTFAQLTTEDQNRVRNAFQQADMSEARREGIEYSPQDNAFPNDWPFDDEGAEVPPLTLQELVDCWNGHEGDAVQQFTVSGIYRDLVFPDVRGEADLGSLLRDTDTLVGKEHWYRLMCIGCSMNIPLGRNPAARIIPFWRDRLNAEFWAATIPTTLEEAKSSGYDQKLDAFFERIIHQSFRDENASGEDADFWRRVFYDFRKMHFYVFRNDLPNVLLQLASSNDVEGSALISFLRSGQIPVAMQMPGIESWTGVIGQSMSAPLLFVMRELRRLNVLPPDRFDNACFYMNSPARRVAHRLGWISDEERRDYSLGNLVSLSERIFDQVIRCEYAEHLLPHFDLPLQWYASQNRR